MGDDQAAIRRAAEQAHAGAAAEKDRTDAAARALRRMADAQRRTERTTDRRPGTCRLTGRGGAVQRSGVAGSVRRESRRCGPPTSQAVRSLRCWLRTCTSRRIRCRGAVRRAQTVALSVVALRPGLIAPVGTAAPAYR